MKVCHISTVHPAFDNRIFHKQCKSLADAGFDVSLIVMHDKDENVDGVQILHLSQRGSRLFRLFTLPWIAMMKALRNKAAVYHFHDPELIPISFLLKVFGKKVIYDVHENYPEQILTKDWIPSLNVRKVLSLIVALFEKLCGKFFNGIITVSDTIADRFPESKVTIVGNMPILLLIDQVEAIPTPGKRTVIYTGGLSRIRGLKELVDAMQYTGDDTQLWLLGKWENENLKTACENSPGWSKVEYKGLVPFGEHYKYIKAADIGIVTFLPLPNHIDSMPNKPYEYLSCGKAMIMSNFPSWMRNFKNMAVFTDPSKPESIAKTINELLNDKEQMEKLSESGRKLIEEQYSWEAESKKLVSVYDKITGRKRN